MTRLKAFLIHLGASLAIFALVLGLLILVWYPWPLLELEGGWKGLRLVALVDIVLGPLLTLLLFKVGKPGLKFDMSMVLLLQVSALGYGMWNLYEARPVMLVHAYDHFQPLSRAMLKEWDPSGSILKQWEGVAPQHVGVHLPDDPVEFADLVQLAVKSPGGLHGLSERYRALHERWRQTLQDAVRMDAYTAHDKDWQQRFHDLIGRLERPVDDLAFFPYVGRRERVFLVFDRETQAIVGVLDIPYDPARVLPEVPRKLRSSNEHDRSG